MAQEEKKKKNRLRYMILSVIIAIIAWSVVTYATDPDITKTFTGIRVEITGEDVLAENGYVVSERELIPKLSVKMRGKRSDLINALGKTKVMIDVSGIKKPGAYELEGTVKVPSSRINVEKVIRQTVPITVAELETREIPVRVNQIGERDGQIVKSTPLKDTVSVKGAKYELDIIESAEVNVDISSLTESGITGASYTLALADNITRDELTTLRISENTIKINNEIYTAKEVPVKVSVKDGIDSELNADETKTEPKTVTVGVPDGERIDFVTVTIDDKAEPGEYKLDKIEGIYIPESSKTVYVTPARQ